MPDNIHHGSAFNRVARAAQSGTIDRRSTQEWVKLLGVTRQRYHQIRSVLGLASRRAMIRKAVTARLSWKARAQVLWRLGIYDRQGDCWKSPRPRLSSCGLYDPPSKHVAGSKRRVLHRLRYGYPQRNASFDLPTCGHDWCINPKHQSLVGFGRITHLRALPRAERVAAALEAGQSYGEIARREGISHRFISQINTGFRIRGVRDKYPIRVCRPGRQPKSGIRDRSNRRKEKFDGEGPSRS